MMGMQPMLLQQMECVECGQGLIDMPEQLTDSKLNVAEFGFLPRKEPDSVIAKVCGTCGKTYYDQKGN